MTHAAVGEKHSLALQSWCAAPLALRMRSASSGALSSALSGHMDRAASAAESVGLAGPWEEEEGLRDQRSSALEDAETSAYWRSLEALQGPSSRCGRLLVSIPHAYVSTCQLSRQYPCTLFPMGTGDSASHFPRPLVASELHNSWLQVCMRLLRRCSHGGLLRGGS